jgi:hypothetical protein
MKFYVVWKRKGGKKYEEALFITGAGTISKSDNASSIPIPLLVPFAFLQALSIAIAMLTRG